METSAQGEAFLKRHEGEVLKAYRDVVGVLTIGVGLTRASGVVDPKPGMTITREESSRLLQLALKRSYEPQVTLAMPDALQHEFDGAVSFHFNTGAIGSASWVAAWRERKWGEVARRIALWRKGGGKVLPGLVRRREEELALIRDGRYEAPLRAEAIGPDLAAEAVPLDLDALRAIREELEAAGYEPGDDPAGISAGAVRAFQHDHDLTRDGIIGRATLSTLQRRIDARRKSTIAGGGGAAAAAGTQAPVPSEGPAEIVAVLPWLEWVAWALLAIAVVRLAWLAWGYRDVVAAQVQDLSPDLAAKLRSF